jgi:hypothetical protein
MIADARALATTLQHRSNEPAGPNGEGLPTGSYQSTCKGCTLGESAAGLPELSCTHCVGLGREKQRVQSVLALTDCNADEWVGNNNGELVCEMSPAPSPPPAPTDTDGVGAGSGGVDAGAATQEGGENRDEL